VPPLMSAALVSPAGGRRRAEYTVAPGLLSGGGSTRGWVQCSLGSGICCPGGGSWSFGGDPLIWS
jgi:hypothetical protein